MNNIEITAFKPKQGLNINHRKEDKLDRGYVAIDKQGGTIAELRIYYLNVRCYACLWVRKGGFATGSGQCGGYGYEKRSEAANIAFMSAGIEITSFGGSGATLEAMEVLARYLVGDEFLTVIEVYG